MKNKGFTLIEMLVALSIFAIVVLSTLDAFLASFASQKRLIEMQAVQREGSYLMETLSREIRMATDINRTDSTSNVFLNNNDSSIEFDNHAGDRVKYCRADEDGSCTDADDGDYIAYGPEDFSNMQIMNSSDVMIENLKFYVPTLTSDSNQPIVIVAMTVTSVKDPSVSMVLQTSVAMRIYN